MICCRMLLISSVAAACALAQATGTATMLGAVTDSSGSVIPGAKITVIQTGTNFTFTSTTTSEGTWYIPSLNSGKYQLKIEAPGFKTYVHDGIQLRTGESPRFDVTLEVGSVTEYVQVTATAPLLGNRNIHQRPSAGRRHHRENPGAAESVLPDLPLHAGYERHKRAARRRAAAALARLHHRRRQRERAGAG